MQEIRKNLSFDFNISKKNLQINDDSISNILSDSFDDSIFSKFTKMNVVHRHYTIKYNNPNKLRLPSIKKEEQISKKETNDDLIILLKDESIIDKKNVNANLNFIIKKMKHIQDFQRKFAQMMMAYVQVNMENLFLKQKNV